MSLFNLEVPTDYDSLLIHFNALRVELDLANQSVHNHKTNLKIKEALEQDLNEEISLLRKKSEGDCNVKIVQQLQEELGYLKRGNEERFMNYEQELERRDLENKELRAQLKSVKSAEQIPEDNQHLLEEITELKGRVDELTQELQKSEEINAEITLESNTLKHNFQELVQQLSDVTEILNSKKQELQEANSLIQTLKDDYMIIKTELDSVKSKPLAEESKGNSLFAEVNDRRMVVEEGMKKMKAKYVTMKTRYDKMALELTKLRQENVLLVNKFKEDFAKQKEHDDEEIYMSYKDQICVLNQLIDSYKKELEEKYDRSQFGKLTVFDNLLEAKRKEMEKLREQYSMRSINTTLQAKDLAEAHRNCAYYELQCLELKSKVEELRQELARLVEENQQLKEQLSEAQQADIRPKSICKTSNKVNDEKENLGDNRQVKFAEDVPDSTHVTRRKCKVTVTKPVVFD